MKFTVAYKPSAEAELTVLWMNASLRQRVADAADRIDYVLKMDPHHQGESRDGATRILFERPLAVQFEIHDDDCYVEVLKIWWIGD